MSATAFQKMRREAESKKAKDAKAKPAAPAKPAIKKAD